MVEIPDHNSPRNPLIPDDTPGTNQAADLIRRKIETLYQQEPSVREEIAEVEHAGGHLTKHQRFIQELNNSGKSLAEIQTAWHNYYVNLPDDEKHRVWQEFYANHARISAQVKHLPDKPVVHAPQQTGRQPTAVEATLKKIGVDRTVAGIQKQLLERISSRSRKQRSAHMRSLRFGLSMGAIVSLFFLFGFFNERFVAPFVTPSKSVSTTPIIIDAASTGIGPEPKIIIPKINVEIPVVYTEPSIEEKAVQRALEDGVLHYATTPNPGELGNGVIFGHSSNNIFNNGKYKFAFVSLKRLETGDTFMLHKDGKRYVYRVFDKKIVNPDQVEVLGHAGKPATMSLITCDPPGTSLKRLVVIGEQISPDPAANIASTAQPSNQQPAVLPSDAPSLWSRLVDWLTT